MVAREATARDDDARLDRRLVRPHGQPPASRRLVVRRGTHLGVAADHGTILPCVPRPRDWDEPRIDHHLALDPQPAHDRRRHARGPLAHALGAQQLDRVAPREPLGAVELELPILLLRVGAVHGAARPVRQVERPVGLHVERRALQQAAVLDRTHLDVGRRAGDAGVAGGRAAGQVRPALQQKAGEALQR
eukprot:5198109-Prymnesium_polylepis.1